jgi:hypothetical protein
VEEDVETTTLLGALAGGGAIALLVWMVALAINLIAVVAMPDIDGHRNRKSVRFWRWYIGYTAVRVVGIVLTGGGAVFCAATAVMFLWR